MGHKHSKQIAIHDSPDVVQYSSPVPKQKAITYRSISEHSSNSSMEGSKGNLNFLLLNYISHV
jgi:hypothetical protein